ncbi:hypothetical protein [Phaeovulum sp.]|uniref:hypothetical protein n=1 Tax=Phaeovulum sp. TaxID=2934796 RepID=UPI0039E7058A
MRYLHGSDGRRNAGLKMVIRLPESIHFLRCGIVLLRQAASSINFLTLRVDAPSGFVMFTFRASRVKKATEQ